MKVKKLLMLGLTMGMGALLNFGNSVSAAGSEYITISARPEGQTNFITCKIYDPDSSQTYIPLCSELSTPIDPASYDTELGTLNLKSVINSLPNSYVSIVNMEDVTISADANIETTINASTSNIILDFGDKTFTEKPYKGSDASTSVNGNNFGKNLTIKSGTLNFVDIISVRAGSLTVQGGTINITQAGEKTVGIGVKNDINISNGTINIPKSTIAFSTDGSFSMSGGTINAVDIETSGFSVDGNMSITGGKINLKSVTEPAGFGILLKNEEKNITISGGELTIDGFNWG